MLLQGVEYVKTKKTIMIQSEKVLKSLLLKLFSLRRERERFKFWWDHKGNEKLNLPELTQLLHELGVLADELERSILGPEICIMPDGIELLSGNITNLFIALKNFINKKHNFSNAGNFPLKEKVNTIIEYLEQIQKDLEMLCNAY